MQFTSFEEFWAALSRLYDQTIEMKVSIAKLRTGTELLASAVQKDHEVIMAHEPLLYRTDISGEAILEDLRRHREQRPSQ